MRFTLAKTGALLARSGDSSSHAMPFIVLKGNFSGERCVDNHTGSF